MHIHRLNTIISNKYTVKILKAENNYHNIHKEMLQIANLKIYSHKYKIYISLFLCPKLVEAPLLIKAIIN